MHLYQGIPKEKLLDLYSQCSIFVLLSNYESAGLAVWDAFAFQKPAITSTAAVLGEYAQKGFSIGIDLPPDLEELATTIKNVLRNPILFVPKKFEMQSWDEVTKKIIAIYEKVLNN